MVAGNVIFAGVYLFPPLVTAAGFPHIQNQTSRRVNDEIQTRITRAIIWHFPKRERSH
ncbi:hypothetical protein [Nostoc punctiforme]|uniref:hypothetical protein n=1 Tax=Nostoc punctiforme TaxID=272131 RepID=UPI001427B046|nr:hypothetical protein [Nostoc punctiforme]